MAVTAERETRVAAVVARPAGVSLAEAVIDAVVEQYTDPGDPARDVLLMITTNPALRACSIDTATMIEDPLAAAITERAPGVDRLTASALSASVGAAARVALRQWLGLTAASPTGASPTAASPSTTGFVTVSGPLPALMRTALAPLAPALDAVAARSSG